MVGYNTVWITDKNPDAVDPTFAYLDDAHLNAMITEFSRQHNTKPKFTQIGKYTMVEFGSSDNRAIFFCDVEDRP